MCDIDYLKQVVVCDVWEGPSQPQPSELIRNLVTSLPKDQDYVKVREDEQHFYVQIGQSKAIDQVYRPLYDRVRGIKEKYHASLQALLTQLQASQGTDTKVAVYTTPMKTRTRKRPVSKSSSVNKVAISRSKRTTNADSTSNDTTLSSSRDKTLFRDTSSKGQTTDDDSISPGAIADGIDKLQSFALHLMAELSIDPNTTAESDSTSKSVVTSTTKTKKKSKRNMPSSFTKPFIANEESVVEQGTVIEEDSNVSLQIGTGAAMKTRSHTRLENSLVNSATKTTINKAAKDSGSAEVATSSSKRNRKAKRQVVASPKSLTKPNGGKSNRRRSQSASNLNASPAKGLQKADSLNKLNTAPTTPSSPTNCGPARCDTPKRILSRRACTTTTSPTTPSTPSSFVARRQESESSRQERLMMSAEKSKKAEEKKKALLDSRINSIKTKREKRMEKFAKNKKAIDHEKEEKMKAIDLSSSVPVGTLPPAPISVMARTEAKAKARNAERRLKLEQLQLEQDQENEAKKKAAAAKTASKRTGAKAAKATKLAKKPVQAEKEATNGHASNDVAGYVMSPIAKQSGINGKINETFTVASGPNPLSTPKADGPVQSLQSRLNSTNNYEMTPPPCKRSYEHNYDISQYIDSDDEEKQTEHNAAQGDKHVPNWCKGKRFLDQVHSQFGLPSEELARWTRSLFPRPMLPVPLEDMGLNIRDKYIQRSSSVNWKTVLEIESALKNDQEQKL